MKKKFFLILLFLLFIAFAAAAEEVEAPDGRPHDWSSFDASAATLNCRQLREMLEDFCRQPKPPGNRGDTVIWYERDGEGRCRLRVETIR